MYRFGFIFSNLQRDFTMLNELPSVSIIYYQESTEIIKRAQNILPPKSKLGNSTGQHNMND